MTTTTSSSSGSTRTYPPEPWDLRGQLHGAAYLVPLIDVPVDLPAGCDPVRLGRYGIVGAVWVSYEPGGVLSYRELMTTLLVRRGWRLLPTITHIWVDSPESRDGGRALWGIPKELASFSVSEAHWSAQDEGGPIASAVVTPRGGLPFRLPVRFSVAQWLRGAAKISPVRSTASLAFSRVSLDASDDGPLAFLAGRTPFASFSLRDFRMSFGG